MQASGSDFEEVLKKFKTIGERMGDIYAEIDTTEIEPIIRKLNEKAEQLGVAGIPISLAMISPYEVNDRFLRLVHQMKLTTEPLEKIAKDTGIPIDIALSLAETYGRISIEPPMYMERYSINLIEGDSSRGIFDARYGYREEKQEQ
jgi:hypothetical protein